LVSLVGAMVLLGVLWLVLGAEGPLQAQGPDIQSEAVTAGIVPPYIYYQGRLVDSAGSPITGTQVMTFSLYAQSSGGTAMATDSHAVTLVNGLFRTYISFPAEHYNGQALWVGVQVENDAEMTPRHYLRPVPYALSLRPGAVVSGSVGAQPTLKLVNPDSGRALQAQAAGWSAVLGTNNSGTAGAVAGINNGAGPGGYFSSAGGDALKVDGPALIDGDLTVNGTVWAKSSYPNVLVVAKSGGDYTSIQAALDVITDATESNPYLVRVMPGIYEEPVTLKPFVTVQGSGRKLTVISYTVTSTGAPASGTVVGADDAGLANLSVVNNHASDRGAAIYNSSVDGMTIDGVSALASGGTFNYAIYNTYSSPEIQNTIAAASAGTDTNYGVYNYYSSPEIEDSVATASGGVYSYGVFNQVSSPRLQNVVARASDASSSTVAIYNYLQSSPTIVDSRAESSGGTYSAGVASYVSSSATIENSTVGASGGSHPRAVFNDENSSTTFTHSTATASGGSLDSTGILNAFGSSATVRFSTVSASAGSGGAYGVENRDGSTASLYSAIISATVGTVSYGLHNVSATSPTVVTVDGAWIYGGNYAIRNGDADFTVRVRSSMLSGGVDPSTGTYQCLLSHDGTNVLNATCQ
jgi:hypothetical protein